MHTVVYLIEISQMASRRRSPTRYQLVVQLHWRRATRQSYHHSNEKCMRAVELATSRLRRYFWTSRPHEPRGAVRTDRRKHHALYLQLDDNNMPRALGDSNQTCMPVLDHMQNWWPCMQRCVLLVDHNFFFLLLRSTTRGDRFELRIRSVRRQNPVNQLVVWFLYLVFVGTWCSFWRRSLARHGGLIMLSRLEDEI